MTEQEYKFKLNKIQIDADLETRNLHIEYANSIALFKIGDIIKDERWAFKIDKITYYIIGGMSMPVYHGFELKKDLTPRKDKNRVAIYGNKATLITN